MTEIAVFLADVGVTVAISAAVVAYMQPHLKSLLTDLCGTAERASFWCAFSNVTLLLVPLIFAMDYRPKFGPGAAVIFEMGAQLKSALVGLVVTILALAIVIDGFLPRSKSASPAKPEARVAG